MGETCVRPVSVRAATPSELAVAAARAGVLFGSRAAPAVPAVMTAVRTIGSARDIRGFLRTRPSRIPPGGQVARPLERCARDWLLSAEATPPGRRTTPRMELGAGGHCRADLTDTSRSACCC